MDDKEKLTKLLNLLSFKLKHIVNTVHVMKFLDVQIQWPVIIIL